MVGSVGGGGSSWKPVRVQWWEWLGSGDTRDVVEAKARWGRACQKRGDFSLQVMAAPGASE